MSKELEVRSIDSITFGLLSPAMIRKMSVVEITSEEVYNEDGTPVPGGVMDLRLGTIEPSQRCHTCGNPPTRCPGHYGHIELPTPVVNYLFAKEIHLLLTITCRSCGRILLPDEKISGYRHEMSRYQKEFGAIPNKIYSQIVREAKRMSSCPHCGSPQYVVKPVKPSGFFEVTPEKITTKLTPAMVRERLERIPDDDLMLVKLDPELGRPEWMVLEVLPVPPVQVRPSIILETGERSEDDLTHKLVDIVRASQRMKDALESGSSPMIVQDFDELLQYHITTYLDNEATGVPPSRHRTNKILKTLSQRLKGKEGRFRKNLSGKRVDFSARTVISPDPSIAVDEVGIPMEVAMELTVPEKVNPFNREILLALVKNGASKYPGARYVIRPDGARIKLEFVKDLVAFADGVAESFIVERHLLDGDYVVFNRQPSLHRISMMGHKVRVLPGRTFRLHPAVCTPYNADFDGDEMNLHVPQSIEAIAETKELLQVVKNYITPRYGAPIVGAIRDFITGAYLLTRSDTVLTRKQFLMLLEAAGVDSLRMESFVKKPREEFSGKEAFSALLPPDLNYRNRASVCANDPTCTEDNCPHEGFVVIENGKLLKGVIDKASLGAEKPGTIVHEILLNYGEIEAHKYLTALTRMISRFLKIRGFSMTYGELVLSQKAESQIEKELSSADGRVKEVISQFRSGKLQKIPGQSQEDSVEAYIMDVLSDIRTKTGELASKSLGLDDSAVVMTRTGARGSDLNLGQMCAALGPQALRGKRISRGYIGRPLPHFKKGDLGPEARGFIKSCYMTGLSPVEFFYHSMGGRESLVDTAVRTQQSGYLQRRLIHALETLKVEYDGTVRDPYENIVEFVYGDDGLDPAKSYHGKFPVETIVRNLATSNGLKLGAKVDRGAAKASIVSKAKNVPPTVAKELENTLMTLGVDPTKEPSIVDATLNRRLELMVDPGESVGVIAAQSIGEPGTQMTLRTFHYAGIKEANVTLGLPRLIELLDARRTPKTPLMEVHLDSKSRGDQKEVLKVARRMVYTSVEDIASEIRVQEFKSVITVVLSKDMMRERGVTPKKLQSSLFAAGFKPKRDKPLEISIAVKEVEGDLSPVVEKLRKVPVSGLSSISRITVREKDGEWVIFTEGSNLSEMLKIPEVDRTRVFTNNIHEIAEVLGIEAARSALIKELRETLEEQGLDVDLRHIMLVASAMSTTGRIKQIGRHGLSGEKVSVLAKAAFERTLPTLVEGAITGSTDRMRGMTERVLAGEEIKAGTGMIDVYVDLRKGLTQR